MRKAASMLLGLTLLVVTMPTGGAAPSSHILYLGAENVVRADSTGYSEVVVQEDSTLRFAFFRNPDLKLQGAGRFIGLFLIQQNAKRPAAIYASQFRLCYRPSCEKGMRWFLMFPYNIKWKKFLTVPAGHYRLYMVTDGAPVTARLMLHGLEGETSITPDVRVRAEVGASAPDPPVDNVYSGGSTYRLASEGAAFTSFWAMSSAAVAHADTECLYKGRPPVPQAVAYTPGCAAFGAFNGGGLGFSVPPGLGGGGSGGISFDPSVSRGRWSFGGSYVAAEPVDFAAFISAWISYD